MPTAEERFWSKVDRSGECWMWTASIRPNGYGQLRFGGATRTAHRVAWMLANGPIPAGLDVCHTCDVRACVRPDHLWLGTRADNNHDMVAKGRYVRGARRSGETNGRAKLTPADVAAIRALPDPINQSAVGRTYGVSRSLVRLIRTGQVWTPLAEAAA